MEVAQVHGFTQALADEEEGREDRDVRGEVHRREDRRLQLVHLRGCRARGGGRA